MNNSIFDILDDAHDEIIGEAVTPAGAYIFQVNEEETISPDDKVVVEFHHIVVRLLFLYKCVRPYLQTAYNIGFHVRYLEVIYVPYYGALLTI